MTVTGRLTDCTQAPLSLTAFTVAPYSTEQGALQQPSTLETGSDGTFSFNIPTGGLYQLTINTDSIRFQVPASGGPFVISDILA